jgi:hypothetical protein
MTAPDIQKVRLSRNERNNRIIHLCYLQYLELAHLDVSRGSLSGIKQAVYVPVVLECNTLNGIPESAIHS